MVLEPVSELVSKKEAGLPVLSETGDLLIILLIILFYVADQSFNASRTFTRYFHTRSVEEILRTSSDV